MANKKKKSNHQNTKPVHRTPRNEFLKNHPLAYLVVAIIAFALGNTIFDFIAQFF